MMRRTGRPGRSFCSQNVKSWKVARVGPVLPERAASEGPRSTGAVGPTRAPFQRYWDKKEKRRAQFGSPRPPLGERQDVATLVGLFDDASRFGVHALGDPR